MTVDLCMAYAHFDDLDLEARSQWVSKSTPKKLIISTTKQAISIKLTTTVASVGRFKVTSSLKMCIYYIWLDHVVSFSSSSSFFFLHLFFLFVMKNRECVCLRNTVTHSLSFSGIKIFSPWSEIRPFFILFLFRVWQSALWLLSCMVYFKGILGYFMLSCHHMPCRPIRDFKSCRWIHALHLKKAAPVSCNHFLISRMSAMNKEFTVKMVPW